jgi:hypothetical protein
VATPTDPKPSANGGSEPETESEQPPPEQQTPQAEQSETFDRPYVERLRTEAAEGRVKGKRADALAAALVSAYAAQSGRLADPSDLAFSDDLLDDDGLVDTAKVEAAVEALLVAKPHLASRTPLGDVGQGARPESDEVSLAGLLRAGA